MKLKKVLCFILSTLMLIALGSTIFAANEFINEDAIICTTAEAVSIEKMSMITDPPFDFEVVSIENNRVTVIFVSQNRINDNPYVGIKATETQVECTSTGRYIFELDKEYSFAYTTSEDSNEVVYNATITAVQISASNVEIKLDNIVKNVISTVQPRAITKNESEPNNTLTTANETYNDFDNIGAISSTSDVDWWKIKFTRAGKANFWLGNIPTNCDYDITLYNSSGTVLARSTKPQQTPELIQYNVEANTYYYIKITSNTGYSNNQYLLRAKWYPYFNSEVYTIKNAGNSLYLTVGQACNASSVSYAYIYTASSTSDDGQHNGQRMRINYNSSGYYTVAPLCSFNGKYRVLDVYGGLSSSDKQLWLYPDNGANEEHFVFEKQADNSFIISFKDSPTYVLDVNSTTKKVYANTRTGSSSQKWIITADSTYNSKEALYNTYNWQWPLSANYNLTSSYGQRTLNNGVSYAFHNGVDISANNGTSVLCPTSAKYAYSGFDDRYGCGYYLIVETNDKVYNSSTQNLRLLFQHLKENATTTYPSITSVTTISQGTVIAKTGDTGTPGSYHLHFGVINDGSNVFINNGNNYDTRTFTNTEHPLMFYPNTNFTYN